MPAVISGPRWAGRPGSSCRCASPRRQSSCGMATCGTAVHARLPSSACQHASAHCSGWQAACAGTATYSSCVARIVVCLRGRGCCRALPRTAACVGLVLVAGLVLAAAAGQPALVLEAVAARIMLARRPCGLVVVVGSRRCVCVRVCLCRCRLQQARLQCHRRHISSSGDFFAPPLQLPTQWACPPAPSSPSWALQAWCTSWWASSDVSGGVRGVLRARATAPATPGSPALHGLHGLHLSMALCCAAAQIEAC